MKTKALFFLPVFALLAGLTAALPAGAAEPPSAHTNITESQAPQPYARLAEAGIDWVVSQDGTLTISGTGRMEDYAVYDEEDESWSLWSPPWWDRIGDGNTVEPKSQIRRVVVEEGVTSVGAGALRDLDGLEEVVLPESVTEIGAFAFNSCTALPEIVIPADVGEISTAAFENCTALEKIVLPDGISIIGDAAFENCTALKAFDIPAGVTKIGEAAFENCTALEEIALPSKVTEIGPWAFDNAASLRKVSISTGTAVIGECAFYACKALEEIAVAEGNPVFRCENGLLLTADGKELVCYCPGRQDVSVQVPEGVARIRAAAFSFSGALKQAQLPGSLRVIEKHAFGHTGLESVMIPEGVETLQFYAFIECEDLDTAYLPLSLTAIEANVFGGTALANGQVYYAGTEADWAQIAIDEKNEDLLGADILYRWRECSHPHLTRHDGVPHTCTADGTYLYWTCDECGAFFLDAYRERRVNADKLVDPAAHNYAVSLSNAPTCCEPGERIFTCTVCAAGTPGHSYTEEVRATGLHHFVDGKCDTLRRDGKNPCGAEKNIDGGSFADGRLNWTISGDGTLTVSGEGDMGMFVVISTQFSSRATHPWADYVSEIRTVVIEEGVTGVANFAFYNCRNLTGICLPRSLEHIGVNGNSGVFHNCGALRDVSYAGTQTDWAKIFKTSDVQNRLNAAELHLQTSVPSSAVMRTTVEIWQEEGDTLAVLAAADASSSAFLAVYDGDGRFLGATPAKLQPGKGVLLSAPLPPGTAALQVMFTDGSMIPLCPAAEADLRN